MDIGQYTKSIVRRSSQKHSQQQSSSLSKFKNYGGAASIMLIDRLQLPEISIFGQSKEQLKRETDLNSARLHTDKSFKQGGEANYKVDSLQSEDSDQVSYKGFKGTKLGTYNWRQKAKVSNLLKEYEINSGQKSNLLAHSTAIEKENESGNNQPPPKITSQTFDTNRKQKELSPPRQSLHQLKHFKLHENLDYAKSFKTMQQMLPQFQVQQKSRQESDVYATNQNTRSQLLVTKKHNLTLGPFVERFNGKHFTIKQARKQSSNGESDHSSKAISPQLLQQQQNGNAYGLQILQNHTQEEKVRFEKRKSGNYSKNINLRYPNAAIDNVQEISASRQTKESGHDRVGISTYTNPRPQKLLFSNAAPQTQLLRSIEHDSSNDSKQDQDSSYRLSVFVKSQNKGHHALIGRISQSSSKRNGREQTFESPESSIEHPALKQTRTMDESKTVANDPKQQPQQQSFLDLDKLNKGVTCLQMDQKLQKIISQRHYTNSSTTKLTQNEQPSEQMRESLQNQQAKTLDARPSEQKHNPLLSDLNQTSDKKSTLVVMEPSQFYRNIISKDRRDVKPTASYSPGKTDEISPYQNQPITVDISVNQQQLRSSSKLSVNDQYMSSVQARKNSMRTRAFQTRTHHHSSNGNQIMDSYDSRFKLIRQKAQDSVKTTLQNMLREQENKSKYEKRKNFRYQSQSSLALAKQNKQQQIATTTSNTRRQILSISHKQDTKVGSVHGRSLLMSLSQKHDSVNEEQFVNLQREAATLQQDFDEQLRNREESNRQSLHAATLHASSAMRLQQQMQIQSPSLNFPSNLSSNDQSQIFADTSSANAASGNNIEVSKRFKEQASATDLNYANAANTNNQRTPAINSRLTAQISGLSQNYSDVTDLSIGLKPLNRYQAEADSTDKKGGQISKMIQTSGFDEVQQRDFSSAVQQHQKKSIGTNVNQLHFNSAMKGEGGIAKKSSESHARAHNIKLQSRISLQSHLSLGNKQKMSNQNLSKGGTGSGGAYRDNPDVSKNNHSSTRAGQKLGLSSSLYDFNLKQQGQIRSQMHLTTIQKLAAEDKWPKSTQKASQTGTISQKQMIQLSTAKKPAKQNAANTSTSMDKSELLKAQNLKFRASIGQMSHSALELKHRNVSQNSNESRLNDAQQKLTENNGSSHALLTLTQLQKPVSMGQQKQKQMSTAPSKQASAVFIRRLGNQDPIINIQIQDYEKKQTTLEGSSAAQDSGRNEQGEMSQQSISLTNLRKSKDFRNQEADLYQKLSDQAKIYKQFNPIHIERAEVVPRYDGDSPHQKQNLLASSGRSSQIKEINQPYNRRRKQPPYHPLHQSSQEAASFSRASKPSASNSLKQQQVSTQEVIQLAPKLDSNQLFAANNTTKNFQKAFRNSKARKDSLSISQSDNLMTLNDFMRRQSQLDNEESSVTKYTFAPQESYPRNPSVQSLVALEQQVVAPNATAKPLHVGFIEVRRHSGGNSTVNDGASNKKTQNNLNLSSIPSAQDASIIKKYGLQLRTNYYTQSMPKIQENKKDVDHSNQQQNLSTVEDQQDGAQKDVKSPRKRSKLLPNSSNKNSTVREIEDSQNQLFLAAKYSAAAAENQIVVATRNNRGSETFYKNQGGELEAYKPNETLSNFNLPGGSQASKRSKASQQLQTSSNNYSQDTKVYENHQRSEEQKKAVIKSSLGIDPQIKDTAEASPSRPSMYQPTQPPLNVNKLKLAHQKMPLNFVNSKKGMKAMQSSPLIQITSSSSVLNDQMGNRTSQKKDSSIKVDEHSCTYGGTSLHMSQHQGYGNVSITPAKPGTVAGAVAFAIQRNPSRDLNADMKTYL